MFLTNTNNMSETLNFQLRSAYAIAKLRKTGYSKNKFYIEALELYKEVCTCTLGFGSIVNCF